MLHYPTSYLPGQAGDDFDSNIVIMGHSSGIGRVGDSATTRKYKFIFAELNELEVGDVIQVNYKQKQYVYTIYGREMSTPIKSKSCVPATTTASCNITAA